MSNLCDPEEAGLSTLKSDQITNWLHDTWLAERTEEDWFVIWTDAACVQEHVLTAFDRDLDLGEEFRFAGFAPQNCPVVAQNTQIRWDGKIAERAGGLTCRFVNAETGTVVETALVGSHYADSGYHFLTMACIPRAFLHVWRAFENECNRLAHEQPENRVIIIGGRTHSLIPTTDWNEIILPGKLKSNILDDVQSFFTRGVQIYQDLNLKPFRKLLLAGVPGTGKTMICMALAKWALEQNYRVIYVSSAVKYQGDDYGTSFSKIQQALRIASSWENPAIIILEELDAYLHAEQKALILNVLDGSESAINPFGTLLITTTNYPEAIDERVLKRPGRLDRIFIVPEVKQQVNAERMLERYLGKMWREEHRELAPELVGYPGAFIREVAIHALTRVAYDELEELSPDLLRESYKALQEQIEARDDFLKQRVNGSNGHTDEEVVN